MCESCVVGSDGTLHTQHVSNALGRPSIWIWCVASSSTLLGSALEAGVWQQQGNASLSGMQITTARPIAAKSSARIHI